MSLTDPSKPASASWQALGTSVVLKLVDRRALARARQIVEEHLWEIDRACSRFRADSELQRVNAGAGTAVRVGPLLLEAVEVGLRAAHLTDGDVDPALGQALEIAGYDRDYELMRPSPADFNAQAAQGRGHGSNAVAQSPSDPPERPRVLVRRTAGWHTISIDHRHSTVRVGPGVRLDLGATAKALAADRAAQAAHEATGSGVLVSLGGDIALAGPGPTGGWRIFVTDDHRGDLGSEGQMISITSGGLATSSTTQRRWTHEGKTMHHIIDPVTSAPVESAWRTVTVAAASCVDANIASTAALVRGNPGLNWLAESELPARLVSRDGQVSTVGEWPCEAEDKPRVPTR